MHILIFIFKCFNKMLNKYKVTVRTKINLTAWAQLEGRLRKTLQY